MCVQEHLGHLADIPTLLVLGGKDECMPKQVDGQALGKRMQKVIGDKKQFLETLQPLVQHCFGSAATGIRPPYLYSCT